MPGNDVTITEVGSSLYVERGRGVRGYVLDPEEVAALREHFAAERMPEGVQALVEEANRIGSRTPRIAYDAEHRAFIRALAAALEAAYSQKGADHDPR